MASGPQLLQTVCMHTRDAVRRTDDAITFRLSNDHPRLKCVKVALGSLEFPMVQWPIEPEWSRLHVGEGVRVTPECDVLRVEEHDDDGVHNRVEVALMLHVNRITDVRRTDAGHTIVECEQPHRLFYNETACAIGDVTWGDVCVLGEETTSLTICHLRGELHYVDPRRFRVARRIACDRGFLHVPPIPSPVHLCELLTRVVAQQHALCRYAFAYDTVGNAVELEVGRRERDVHVVVETGGLARALGFAADRRAAAVAPPRSQDALPGQAAPDAAPGVVVRGDAFPLWAAAALEPGWYVPSLRPMATGPPLRLAREMELALNRLYFPLADRLPENQVTAHFLVFADSRGRVHHCPVFAGAYTPHSLCAYLEERMSALSGDRFAVDYDDERFTLSCEASQGDLWVPAPFSLLLGHPAQFDPMRLGFRPAPLHGADAYRSTERVVVPRFQGRSLANVYRVDELGHQRRLQVSGAARPALSGVVQQWIADDAIVQLDTYVGVPFAHGFEDGDVVFVDVSPPRELTVRTRDGWREESFATSVARSCHGVVVAAPENASPWSLFVRVPRGFEDEIGALARVSATAQPFSLGFAPNLERAVPAAMLGFAHSALWGLDGATASPTLGHLPPYVSPHVTCVEHPDYVLVYIDEGKRSTGLQHAYAGRATSPFAKLVLFPMVREERMLPREVSFAGGEGVSTLTFRFTNPDGTPYRFHGAQFSISLNLFCA